MKFIKFSLIVVMSILLSSCYSSHIAIGNMTHDHPVKTVGSKKNHYLFGGLVPLSRKQSAKDFVGEAQHYKVRTSHKFVDCILTFVTAGIYTPVTVTYYMSAVDANQKYQRERESFEFRNERQEQFDNTPSVFQEENNIKPSKPKQQPKQKNPPKQKSQPQAPQYPQQRQNQVEGTQQDSEHTPSIEEIRRQMKKRRETWEQQSKEIIKLEEELMKLIN